MKTASECITYLFNKPHIDMRKVFDAMPDKRLTDPVAIMSIRDMMDMDENYSMILGEVVLCNSQDQYERTKIQ